MLIEVWTKSGWPPANATVPRGLKVTPEEAYRIFARRERLSLKHRWICFRDDKHYYIPDGFGKSIAARTAYKYGVKVNGSTGALDWQVRPYRCSTQK